MKRFISATRNSLRALKVLLRHEATVQQEFIALAVAIPLGMLIAPTLPRYALLIGVVLFVLIVEILNTAVEAACDAYTRDFNTDIQLAKDCGSLAVSLSLIIAVATWGWAFWAWFAGV
jgi:diacylglycerol kinase (ATP)